MCLSLSSPTPTRSRLKGGWARVVSPVVVLATVLAFPLAAHAGAGRCVRVVVQEEGGNAGTTRECRRFFIRPLEDWLGVTPGTPVLSTPRRWVAPGPDNLGPEFTVTVYRIGRRGAPLLVEHVYPYSGVGFVPRTSALRLRNVRAGWRKVAGLEPSVLENAGLPVVGASQSPPPYRVPSFTPNVTPAQDAATSANDASSRSVVVRILIAVAGLAAVWAILRVGANRARGSD